jgi:hypothetical protein
MIHRWSPRSFVKSKGYIHIWSHGFIYRLLHRNIDRWSRGYISQIVTFTDGHVIISTDGHVVTFNDGHVVIFIIGLCSQMVL